MSQSPNGAPLPMNQLAELSVICSILKHPESIRAFDSLSVADFTHGEFAKIFAVMRDLDAAGRVVTPATVNWNPPEDQLMHHGHDWEEEWVSLVGVIKEGTLRREIGVALFGETDPFKWAGMTTPALILEASKKQKAAEAEAGKWKGYVEQYVPTLAGKSIDWGSLVTGKDIVEQQGTTLAYIVDEIIPRHRVTMLFGQEKSGKSIVALDLVSHITNGRKWLNRETLKTPCLYIDLEDGILGSYITWLREVGSEEVRFITIRSEHGIPALDDPGLLALCAEKQPVIVLDSLHKLFTREKERKGGSAWNAGDYEPVLEKIRQLCVAGATVILIHHSTKAEKEQYRDSSAIGANVDFLFAVVGDEPENGVKRVHLIGKPSRGAQPPTVHILAFPHIIDHGHLCLDAGLEKEDCAAYEVAKEVQQHGPAESRTALWKRVGGRKADVLAAIAKSISFGYLKESESGEINLGSMPLSAPVPMRVPMAPKWTGTDSGTDESEPF